jgi:hypothetical protein
MSATPEEKADSINLHAFLASESLMVILTKNGDEVKLVRRIFAPVHRKQVRGNRWHVWNLKTYEELPLVKNAIEAYRKQYTLEGTCPAVSQP